MENYQNLGLAVLALFVCASVLFIVRRNFNKRVDAEIAKLYEASQNVKTLEKLIELTIRRTDLSLEAKTESQKVILETISIYLGLAGDEIEGINHFFDKPGDILPDGLYLCVYLINDEKMFGIRERSSDKWLLHDENERLLRVLHLRDEYMENPENKETSEVV